MQTKREGHWLILDELNLAPTDILEALNRVRTIMYIINNYHEQFIVGYALVMKRFKIANFMQGNCFIS